MTARTATLLLALLAGSVLALAGCGDDGRMELRARFDDAKTLPEQGKVTVADVTVGTVTDVELDRDELAAIVTMRVDDDLALPAQVTARLRKTSLLGEHFVELVPHDEAGGRLDPDRLITDTRVESDLETLVARAGELVTVVAGDTIARAIDAGATGLGGRGDQLDAILDDAGAIAGAYDDRSEDLVAIIDDLEALLATTAPEADRHAEAVDELSAATDVLRAEDDRLIDALVALGDLSAELGGLVSDHRRDLDDTLLNVQAITAEVVANRDDLDRLWAELAGHNEVILDGVNLEQTQVFLDLLICGLNDEPGDPVRGCDEAPQSIQRPAEGQRRPPAEPGEGGRR